MIAAFGFAAAKQPAVTAHHELAALKLASMCSSSVLLCSTHAALVVAIAGGFLQLCALLQAQLGGLAALLRLSYCLAMG